MNRTTYRAAVLVGLIVVLTGAIAWKVAARRSEAGLATAPGLPTVLDFGMGTCEACKKMKPILDGLAVEYEGRAAIRIIDIGEHPTAMDEYRIEVIPTQVFLDAAGNEVFRNKGPMPKEDIVAKLREMGVE